MAGTAEDSRTDDFDAATLEAMSKALPGACSPWDKNRFATAQGRRLDSRTCPER